MAATPPTKSFPDAVFAELQKVDFASVYKRHVERGTALAMVAELDAALREALEVRFVKETSVLGETFNEYGPLGNTAAKAKIAFLLGIIANEDYQDIDRICKIRNRFAHKLEAENCDHSAVSGQIDNLKTIENFDQVSGKPNKLLELVAPSKIEPVTQQFARLGIDVSQRNFRLTVTIFLLIAKIKAS